MTSRAALGTIFWALACNAPGAPLGEDAAPKAQVETPAPPPAPSSSVARAEGTTRWTGTYKSGAAPFYVPDGGEWSGYKWRGDDGGDGLGEGSLSIAIAGSHAVTGEASGAIGDALIVGVATDDQLTASVRRKDPADHGLTGTLVATKSAADRLDGTMRLSFGDAHVLREVAFSLGKGPAK